MEERSFRSQWWTGLVLVLAWHTFQIRFLLVGAEIEKASPPKFLPKYRAIESTGALPTKKSWQPSETAALEAVSDGHAYNIPILPVSYFLLCRRPATKLKGILSHVFSSKQV